MELARSIGAKAILVRTGYGADEEKAGEPIWDAVADRISDAAALISTWVKEVKGDFVQE
jgi:phosphoglycolate phosphatase-like HAD superfamily hydrolase